MEIISIFSETECSRKRRKHSWFHVNSSQNQISLFSRLHAQAQVLHYICWSFAVNNFSSDWIPASHSGKWSHFVMDLSTYFLDFWSSMEACPKKYSNKGNLPLHLTSRHQRLGSKSAGFKLNYSSSAMLQLSKGTKCFSEEGEQAIPWCRHLCHGS